MDATEAEHIDAHQSGSEMQRVGTGVMDFSPDPDELDECRWAVYWLAWLAAQKNEAQAA